MKIYFAGSIRGGGQDAELYKKIIEHLRNYGDVIGGEYADEKLLSNVENADNRFIYKRDSKRLAEADVLVAEVTAPSLGVGYEIGMAVANSKRILCLYRPHKGRLLSALIAGSPDITHVEYSTLNEV